MKRLCIETSTEWGVIAIIQNQTILYQADIPKGFQNSKFILPELSKGLKETSISWQELSYIVCGVGPGSYTGIRIGAAVAKSISFAMKIPLIGLSTLKCFSPKKEGHFAVILDAKISGFYALFGKKNGNEIVYEGAPAILSLDEVSAKLKGDSEIITTDLKTFQKFRLDDGVESPIDPLQMVKLADILFKDDNFTTNGELPLLYLRKTQAEIAISEKLP